MANPAMFRGLDLTSSRQKPTAYALLDSGLTLRRLGNCDSDDAVVALVDAVQPAVVAIDAPLSLPLGLCCLEISCSCQPLSDLRGRECERVLSRRGISSYYTTKRSIIKKMVCRGISLKKELESRGYRVIEIYPYASKVQLFGRSLPRKTTLMGRRELQERLLRVVRGLDAVDVELYSHDSLDAIVAALTGYYFHHGHTEAVGWEDEGLIHLPTEIAP